MKITAVETHVCNARMRNWVFVRVLTDEPGLVGWGEATLEWHTRGVVGAIADLEPLLLGEDPTRVEHLWQRMFRQQFWHGNNLVRGTAISGIDLALWDILGKVHGVPCHRLWGGPVRDRIRLYAHVGEADFYAVESAGRFAELALGLVERGFTAFKALPVPPTMPLEGLGPVRLAESYVAAMRDAVGDEIDIMVDCHARPSPTMGKIFARALEPFDLFWLEEPCWPEHPEAIAEIARSVRTPVATGERLVGLHAFRDLLDEPGVRDRPARHHALRRPVGGAADRRARRGVRRRARAAQPAGPGQHRGVARARVRDAVVRDLRGGQRRRALARRGRPGGVHRARGRALRDAERAAGARRRDRPGRGRAPSVPAGDTPGGLLSGRRRRRLVSRRGGASTSGSRR